MFLMFWKNWVVGYINISISRYKWYKSGKVFWFNAESCLRDAETRDLPLTDLPFTVVLMLFQLRFLAYDYMFWNNRDLQYQVTIKPISHRQVDLSGRV